ncbi:MAG TPA: hypothetical protein VGU02_04855, partial [Gaiellaceae bacterium]|nr:hypothetical protein [Gaiellaceae bacterium]
FTQQSKAVLTRLAQAIHDSGDTTINNGDPGVGACGQPITWCQSAVIPGATFTNQWASFSTWTQTGISFADQPVTFTAGATAGPITVQLKTGSIVTPALADTPVTLASTSPKGQFSTSPSGPRTPTLTVTIPAGSPAAAFYYQDTEAGSVTISATLAGQPPASQVETVTAAAPSDVELEPAAVTVMGGSKRLFAAHVTDGYGNPTDAPVKWSLSSATVGAIVPTSGASTTFTASSTASGRARLTASVGALKASAVITVKLAPARIGGTLARHIHGHEIVTVWVVRGKARAKGVAIAFTVRHGSSIVAKVTGRTDAHGRVTWRSKHPLPAGRYTVKAAIR